MMSYRGKTAMSLENVKHIHKKNSHEEDWRFQKDYRLEAAICRIINYYLWRFINYTNSYLVQSETEKDTSRRFSNITECTN